MKSEIFAAKNGKTVTFLPEPRGITLMHMADSGHGIVDAFNVGLKRSSVKQLIKSVKYDQKYIIGDNSLHVWSDGGELHFLFWSMDHRIHGEVIFAERETKEILQFLQEYSILN